MAEIFEPNVRYAGASLGYQTASTIAGAVSPVLALFLLTISDNQPWLVALYMVGMSVITIVAAWLAPETHRGDRRGETSLAFALDENTRIPVTAGRD